MAKLTKAQRLSIGKNGFPVSPFSPQKTSDTVKNNVWYYHERRGRLDVYVHRDAFNTAGGSICFEIPLRAIVERETKRKAKETR